MSVAHIRILLRLCTPFSLAATGDSKVRNKWRQYLLFAQTHKRETAHLPICLCTALSLANQHHHILLLLLFDNRHRCIRIINCLYGDFNETSTQKRFGAQSNYFEFRERARGESVAERKTEDSQKKGTQCDSHITYKLCVSTAEYTQKLEYIAALYVSFFPQSIHWTVRNGDFSACSICFSFSIVYEMEHNKNEKPNRKHLNEKLI